VSLHVENLSFRIGSFRLGPLDLAVEEGEAFVVLGPPGSGKTLLLECICGLLRPESGRIRISGKDVTAVPPGKRGIGYVPQDYALFPHLTVEGNILFGLGRRGGRDREARRKALETAGLLGIEGLLGRDVRGLSGGERQRVALARALARRPGILLLDEPVSALDEATREKVLGELRDLQRALGFTMVYVCHNLEEAFGVAHRAGLMGGGRFLQVGTMGDLLRRPRSLFAARFMRCENILAGEASPLPGGEESLFRAEGLELLFAGKREGPLQVALRPEELEILPAGAEREDRRGGVLLEARVTRVEDRGGYEKLELATAGPRLSAHISRETRRKVLGEGAPLREGGVPVRVWVRAGAVLPLDGVE